MPLSRLKATPLADPLNYIWGMKKEKQEKREPQKPGPDVKDEYFLPAKKKLTLSIIQQTSKFFSRYEDLPLIRECDMR